MTRKVKKATQRNLLKRWMREAFQMWRNEFYNPPEIGTAIDIVILYNGDGGGARRKGQFVTINRAVKELLSTVNDFSSR